MTAEEKAKELVDRFILIRFKFPNGSMAKMSLDEAKQCALKCVDELKKECVFVRESYWYEVKQEIIKL